MIDGHGDDLFRYKEMVKINFSTNIPQTVNHDGLVTHLYRWRSLQKISSG